ncbi:excinuclease ABC subunit C [Carboxydocella sp. ULO1]|nr:excinuclease ABC subunit C [Carboxydocella sp. ULO1]
MRPELQHKLEHLPEQPGVYLMKNAGGQVIYVGKARVLKNRVRSYFQSTANQTEKVRAMVEQIADLEYIITDTEVDALMLECNLIKKYRPRYNVLLKDDKHYPYIKVTVQERYPRVLYVRKVERDGARYFGPYVHAGAVKETLHLLKKLFPLRSCPGSTLTERSRPCLQFHIRRCSAPCSGEISREQYLRTVEDVLLFLEGKYSHLIKQLQQEMNKAAEKWDFERAARLRDQIKALEILGEKQKMLTPGGGDRDVLAVARGIWETCGVILLIRHGTLLGREVFFLGDIQGYSREEIMAALVKQYYSQAQFIPGEVILAEGVPEEEREVIEQWLQARRGKKVELLVPRRGEKKALTEMAHKNAVQELELKEAAILKERETREQGLKELAQALGLATPPRRIECYDISNTQGSESVGSMVVFLDGKPAPECYRRFKIKTVIGPDDFASMAEVLRRRLERARKGDEKFAQLPDLLIVDGGKGQLAAARRVMEELGFGHIPTFGLAKEEEWLFAPHQSEPIILPRQSQGLYLLQRIRDEAHRFALTYHRKLRTQRNLRSVLEEVPGIGSKRKQALYKHFGSLAKIRAATVEELAAVPGMNQQVAQALWEWLRRWEAEN